MKTKDNLDTFIITFYSTFCFDHSSHHIDVTVHSDSEWRRQKGMRVFALMLTDPLQDSPREPSAHARELTRMKFTEGPEDFNNILFQNQQLIVAATEAAKPAANTVSQLSEIFKAVLPSIVSQKERADPDPTHSEVFQRKPFTLPIWLQTFFELHHVVQA